MNRMYKFLYLVSLISVFGGVIFLGVTTLSKIIMNMYNQKTNFLQNTFPKSFVMLILFLFAVLLITVVASKLTRTKLPLIIAKSNSIQKATNGKVFELVKRLSGETLCEIKTIYINKGPVKPFLKSFSDKTLVLNEKLIELLNVDELETLVCREMYQIDKTNLFSKVLSMLVYVSLPTVFALSCISIEQIGDFWPIITDDLKSLLEVFYYIFIILGILGAIVTMIRLRKFELEADAYSVRMTSKKEALISALNKLINSNSSQNNINHIESIISLTPVLGERLKHLELQ